MGGNDVRKSHTYTRTQAGFFVDKIMENRRQPQNIEHSIQNNLLEPSVATTEMSDEERLKNAVDFLRKKFAEYDEKWIIGHKGDQARNLQDLGILDENIDVTHVHSSLGVNTEKSYTPPAGSSNSYEGYLTAINPDINTDVSRVVEQGKRVVALMPFPNEGLQRLIAQSGQPEQFTMTAPVADYAHFSEIEDKITFGRTLQEVLDQTQYAQNIIPWTIYEKPWSIEELRTAFHAPEDAAFYFQRALSAGGDGTIKITSEDDLQELVKNPEWESAMQEGKLKASLGIEHAYPANGTGCIVPIDDGTCVVLIDPPSHKPVGLESLGSKPGGGVGNDWSTSFSEEILTQYTDIVTALGQELYKKYGYTGVFGPDGIVDYGGDKELFRITEVNPRWQGTTPYQTQNALMNARLPLELIHYMVKLTETDSKALKQVHEIIGDPQEYNSRAIREKGGFYIKVGAPKEPKIVHSNLNGPWIWNGDELKPLSNNDGLLTPTLVYSGNLNGHTPQEGHSVVWVKAPNPGDRVGGELAPIGYIMGSGITVFDANRPEVTPEGQNLYNFVNRLMFSP